MSTSLKTTISVNPGATPVPPLESNLFISQCSGQSGRRLEKGSYKPGQRVPESGIYRVEHGPHRLMHSATLVAHSRFPVCRMCGRSVRFFLLRPVNTSQVVPFRSNAFLEEYAGGLDLVRSA